MKTARLSAYVVTICSNDAPSSNRLNACTNDSSVVSRTGALLPKMFGSELMGAFQAFKSIWDPDLRMNPGKVV